MLRGPLQAQTSLPSTEQTAKKHSRHLESACTGPRLLLWLPQGCSRPVRPSQEATQALEVSEPTSESEPQRLPAQETLLALTAPEGVNLPAFLGLCLQTPGPCG